MSPHLRSVRIPMLAALACLLLVALTVAESAGAATRNCRIPSGGDIEYLPDNSGNVYYIRVTNTSCATGYRVVRAYYRCRRANGKRGTCRKRIVNFRCSETRRYTRIPGEGDTDFRAVATCRRGSASVKFGYRQEL